MKNLTKCIYLALSLLIIFSLSCSKESEEDENTLDLSTSYEGIMRISISSTLPPFDASTQVKVTIDKELEMILFETGSLSFSGDTTIRDDSKIIRTGNWTIAPSGDMEKVGDDVHINVDVGITVTSDVQKIYAKDHNSGQWVLAYEIDYSSTPNSDIFFSLEDAEINGSIVQTGAATGSISFSLFLSPTLVP